METSLRHSVVPKAPGRTLAQTVGAIVCLCALLGAPAIGAGTSFGAPADESGAAATSTGSLVRVFPTAPMQGDTLTVLVAAPSGSDATVTFDGNPVATYPVQGGGRRALIGTDPDVASGAHRIGVVVHGPDGAVRRSTREVRLGATRFGVRHLSLPPSTFGLITSANLATERRALVPVLSRRTPVAWWHGTFSTPSGGPIASPYGEQGWYNGHREWWHAGVDFAAPQGAPVVAANTGVVALARALPLGGNTVVLDHGQGVLTEYLHLSAFAVREGERVVHGAMVGRIGSTGLVTGPGLHWGLYVNGIPVNPLFWTAPQPGLTAP